MLQEHHTKGAVLDLLDHKPRVLKRCPCDLVHLRSFPLWEGRAADVMVEDDTGYIRVLDWSGGLSPARGNSSLLASTFHCGPAPREESRAERSTLTCAPPLGSYPSLFLVTPVLGFGSYKTIKFGSLKKGYGMSLQARAASLFRLRGPRSARVAELRKEVQQ